MRNTERMMEMTSHRGRIKLESRHQIPGEELWEDKKKQYLNVPETDPICSGAYHVEKATITGT